MSFNQLKAKPEHIREVVNTLKGGECLAPHQIAKLSGLSLTAVYGAIAHLEVEGKIRVIRQNKTPKLRASLL